MKSACEIHFNFIDSCSFGNWIRFRCDGVILLNEKWLLCNTLVRRWFLHFHPEINSWITFHWIQCMMTANDSDGLITMYEPAKMNFEPVNRFRYLCFCCCHWWMSSKSQNFRYHLIWWNIMPICGSWFHLIHTIQLDYFSSEFISVFVVIFVATVIYFELEGILVNHCTDTNSYQNTNKLW